MLVTNFWVGHASSSTCMEQNCDARWVEQWRRKMKAFGDWWAACCKGWVVQTWLSHGIDFAGTTRAGRTWPSHGIDFALAPQANSTRCFQDAASVTPVFNAVTIPHGERFAFSTAAGYMRLNAVAAEVLLSIDGGPRWLVFGGGKHLWTRTGFSWDGLHAYRVGACAGCALYGCWCHVR